MKKLLALSYFTLLISYSLFSQNVGIGTNAPNASAQLDITSTNKGVLVPRLTNAQMLAIASPANGLLVFNTDSACFAYRNASAWVFLKGNATASNDWSTKGNAGTNPAINFIGTTDNQPVVFRQNNTRAGLLTGPGSGGTNTGLGVEALNSVNIGSFNTALGVKALYLNTDGINNTATGVEALSSNENGNNNTANGVNALRKNKGSENTAIGMDALFSNTTGNSNTATGRYALYGNTTGNDNTATGLYALLGNSEGYSNVAIGTSALASSTNLSNLVAIGDSALYNNGSGATQPYDGIQNVAVGSKALYANTVGLLNTAVGFNALRNNITGASNTAIGNNALLRNTAGNDNIAIGGDSTLAENLSGIYNVAIGSTALFANKTGTLNTAIGHRALYAAVGSGNTALGYNANAGVFHAGSNNVFIGREAGYEEAGSNRLYISNGATNAVNTLIYGEFDNKFLRSNGRMEINSDNTLNDGLRVIKNYAAATNKNLSAVYGENAVDDSWGIGVEGKGGRTGVQGFSQGTGSQTYAGVKGVADGSSTGGVNLGLWGQASGSSFANRAVVGEASGGNGEKYGLYGYASGAGTNYGVYAEAISGTNNYAGYFKGNVIANGKLTITTTAGTTGLDLASSDAYAEMRIIRNTLGTADKNLYLGFNALPGSAINLYSEGLTPTITLTGHSVGIGKVPLTTDDDSRLQVKQKGSQNVFGMEASNSTNHWDFYATSDVANTKLNMYYNGVFKGAYDNVTGAYTAASDRRLKKDISPQQPVLNNVLQLKAYQYHYLDNQPTDRFSNGFMAQDVQQLFPDAVVENVMKDGETRLGINYQYFTVLAIKGLQEQQQQIQSQEERIAKLEALVKTLTERK